MLLVIGLMVFVVVVAFVKVRREHKERLAGLHAGRPQFMVAPPTRRVGRRRDERL